MTNEHLEQLFAAARNRTPLYVRTDLARAGGEVPACLVGFCCGVSDRTATFASGDRILVVTLASIREIIEVPNVAVTIVGGAL